MSKPFVRRQGGRIKKQVGAAALLAVIAGTACQYPAAYVYKPREFDRSAPGYGRLLLDRDSVTVCTSPFRAADEQVAALAEEACEEAGRSAVDPERRFGVCPMLLASAVVYRCIAPSS
jgi:hypothetical protein